MKDNLGFVIVDNAGNIILRLGSYGHVYQDAMDAALDAVTWTVDPDTSAWEGHDEDVFDVDLTDTRNWVWQLGTPCPPVAGNLSASAFKMNYDRVLGYRND